MKNLIILGLIGVAAWQIYAEQATPVITNADIESLNARPKNSAPKYEQNYSVDGREHCSEMTSCNEAKFFIRNCPNTKMDGDNDGIPCERQYCGH